MNETLRIFWTNDREKAAKAIREILQFDVPSIGAFGDIILVQRTDLTVEQEVLLLLHFAGEEGFSAGELKRHAKFSVYLINKAIASLESPQLRQIVILSNAKHRLTDLGAKRVREELSDKLLLQ